MSAAPRLSPVSAGAAADAFGHAPALLARELIRQFPSSSFAASGVPRTAQPHLPKLFEAPLVWIEVALGEGGVAWLAAWTALHLAHDPLGRPALWVDTHCTLTAGDLSDLSGRLVVVRPADPHEAHAAAEIALRAGSFSLVALEMHRALHPTPLGRLARLAAGRRGEARAQLVVWGEPPSFVAPPNGVARTSFRDAMGALAQAIQRHRVVGPAGHSELSLQGRAR